MGLADSSPKKSTGEFNISSTIIQGYNSKETQLVVSVEKGWKQEKARERDIYLEASVIHFPIWNRFIVMNEISTGLKPVEMVGFGPFTEDVSCRY